MLAEEAESSVDLIGVVTAAAPTVLAVVVVAGVLFGARRVFDRWERNGRARHFTRQLTLIGLSVAGLILIVTSLPIPSEERGNLLSLIGLVLSAAIALSSTTLLGNMLAGLMLRSLRHLHTGDFVECESRMGRVTDLGLLFTQIQSPDSDLWHVPNLYLVQHPMRVVRNQGTIVTAEVSLGYDVPRGRVRDALLAAGEQAGLKDPFVLVVELGDFSVTYRCGGLLEEVKSLVSANSRLRAAMLDALHGADIEIVSPTFMNTRALQDGRRMMPSREEAPDGEAADEEGSEVEDIAFEEAEAAEVTEALKERLSGLEKERDELREKLKGARKEGGDGEAAELEGALEKLDRRVERLQEIVAARTSEKKA